MKALPGIGIASFLGWCAIGSAQVIHSGTTTADAFLATGSPTNPDGTDLTGENFGAAGLLVVAPPASTNGEYRSVLKFNFAAAVNLFNTNLGPGNWNVTAITLQLASNYGAAGETPNNAIFPTVSGGQFVIEWLADNDWAEGTGTPNLPTTDGVTYSSLPGLLSGAHEILGTNIYVPPGDNLPVTYQLPLSTNIVNAITSGGDMTLLFYAADNQISYLFNSHEYGRGNQPMINVTASPPPPRITMAYLTNGNFHINGTGTTNTVYQVQYVSMLTATNWQSIGAATSDSSGAIQFDDAMITGQMQRFYRLAK